MPSAICKSCGRETNSACSNYWNVRPVGEVTECYAAWEYGKYVKGCAYDKLDDSKYSPKHFADHLISRPKEYWERGKELSNIENYELGD